ncbi:GTD-binding domain [Sesbania bispinosa]|nr:GTD-binding domain [Sesbania bispinosa]
MSKSVSPRCRCRCTLCVVFVCWLLLVTLFLACTTSFFGFPFVFSSWISLPPSSLSPRQFLRSSEFGVAPRFCSHPKAPPLDRQPSKSHASANKGSVSEYGVLEEKEENLEEEMFDVMSLTKLVKIERQRFCAAYVEIKKERVATSMAEKEAMAMILRLESEKSSVEIRANQFWRMVFWILPKSNTGKICMAALVLLRFIVHDHDNLFVAAEAVHSLGISVLIYKLIKEKTCAGLSLKSQELTAMFLAVRLYCSFVMEYDIHTILDLATFATTMWVIYMIRFKLKSSYMEEKDNFAIYYVAIPCAVLALFIHPSTSHHLLNRIFWAFCVYLEAVSVLPQLRVMQNTKIVEPFTAHYVFALGVARFLSCAHWVLQVLDTRGHLLVALGYGLWPSMVLISEIVQTFILADFCYYYVKSVFGGQLVLRLSSGVV